ncbi:glutathione S-transferase family protein [Aliiroseovarius crassostreae]|uniref:glutathione S-transferase family protein n=1 Tax=Aliiroseovarius crassostreae TaxID=154981 RepID=UPI003C7E26DA
MTDHPFRLHHVQYGRSFRVLWLIEEIGLADQIGQPLEVVEYQIGSKEMFEGGLRDVSPATRIPALELDGVTMSESGAITEYLVERYAPDLGVAPGQEDRATYLQWIHYAETMASLIEQLNLQMVFLRPPAKASPIVLKLNVARLRHTLAGLEARLDGRDWLLDRGFSAADIMFGFNLFAAPYYVKLDEFPNIRAYQERMQAMPSYQRAVAREGVQKFYAQDFYPVPEE